MSQPTPALNKNPSTPAAHVIIQSANHMTAAWRSFFAHRGCKE